MRRAVEVWSKEARAVAKQGQLILLRRRRPEPTLSGPRAVLFVHGYGAAGPVFDPMREDVERALGLPTLDFTYRSGDAFPKIASALASVVENAASGRSLAIVGHSLGGLLARWVLQELGGAERVDTMLTLATPHAGTRSAVFAIGPLGAALSPGSPVIERLGAGRARAGGVRHAAFVAGADLMVTPPASAAALPDAEVRWFDDVGHNAILYEPEVRRSVVEVLES